MLAPATLLGHSFVRGPHFLKNQPAWTTWIVAAKQGLMSVLLCPMNGTEVGESGNGRVAPSKAQEGGPSVATGLQKLFSHPVLPELLHRTWKSASVGMDEELCDPGVCVGGEPASTGVQACSWLPRATLRVLMFLWWKSQEKGEQRGGVGAKLTLRGGFPSP